MSTLATLVGLLSFSSLGCTPDVNLISKEEVLRILESVDEAKNREDWGSVPRFYSHDAIITVIQGDGLPEGVGVYTVDEMVELALSQKDKAISAIQDYVSVDVYIKDGGRSAIVDRKFTETALVGGEKSSLSGHQYITLQLVENRILIFRELTNMNRTDEHL